MQPGGGSQRQNDRDDMQQGQKQRQGGTNQPGKTGDQSGNK